MSFVQMREQLRVVVNDAPTSQNHAAAAVGAPVLDDQAARRARRGARGAAQAVAAADANHSVDDDDVEVQVVNAAPVKKARRVYTSMKKSKLQELCRQEGLDTAGSEKELIERHKAFIMAWNANCDSVQPHSREEIAAEINRMERSRRQVDFAARRDEALMKQLIPPLGQNAAATTTNNPQFNQKISDGFAKLIQAGKKRMMEENNKKPAAKANEEDDFVNDNVMMGDGVFANDNEAERDNAETVAGVPQAEQVDSVVDESSTRNLEEDLDASNAPVDELSAEDFKENQGETDANRESVTVCTVDIDQFDSGARSYSTKPESRSNSPKKRRRSNESRGHVSESGSIIGPWSCQVCTFYNETNTWSRAPCEMCRKPRTCVARSVA